MTVPTTIPAKVRTIMPMCGSANDGEALGACRAIGRVLGRVGLDYGDLAAVIPTGIVDNVHNSKKPAWDDKVWTSVRPRRVRHHTYSPRQEAQNRERVRFCQGLPWSLSQRERDFIASIAKLRGDLTVKQGDWLAVLTDRLEQEVR